MNDCHFLISTKVVYQSAVWSLHGWCHVILCHLIFVCFLFLFEWMTEQRERSNILPVSAVLTYVLVSENVRSRFYVNCMTKNNWGCPNPPKLKMLSKADFTLVNSCMAKKNIRDVQILQNCPTAQSKPCACWWTRRPYWIRDKTNLYCLYVYKAWKLNIFSDTGKG